MVWKSDRWNALVDVVVAEDIYKEHTEPEMIQIAYHRGSAVVREEVYEDPERVEMPRLLVSLSSVSALKELCEHEHARSDKLGSTLSKCRAAYYKELRWLRDQLQLAYRTDEEAEARKALLTPDDFEVYWYEPAQYVDDDTRDFLLKCIAETNRKLIDENNKLRSELAQHHILESAILPTVLRRLRKEYSPSAILTELHAQLKTKQDIKDFQEGVSKLLNQKITLQVEAEDKVPDDALLAAQAELAALREERAAQESQLAEMRLLLSSGIDAQLERERANAERERADLVQARAEFILRQHEALKRELRSGEMEVAHRVRRSVSKLTEVMQTLTPAGSRSNSPIKGGCGGSPTKFHTPLNFMESPKSGESKEEASFDGALSMLDEVAAGFTSMAGDVVQEMQDLRNRVAMLEMSKRCQELPAADPETMIEMETDKSSSRLRADLEALQLRFVEEQKKLVAEKLVSERLQGQLSEANVEIERLRERVLFLESKVDKLRARVKTLEEASGVEPDADSDGEDTGGRYQTPYRKRALISTKNRWELLAEDAACRRRQTRLNELRLRGIDPNSPEGEAMLAGRGPGHEAAASRSVGHRQEAMAAGRRSHHQEVAKAFHFLSAGQTLSATPPPASSDLVVLRQLEESQPQLGRPTVSRSSRRLSSPIPFRAPSTSPLSSTPAETPSAGQSMSSTSPLASSDLAALRQLDQSQPQLGRPTVSQPSRPRRMSSPIPLRAQTASVAMRETRYAGQAGYRVADEVSLDQAGNPSGLLALPGYREGGIPAPPQRRLSDFNGTGQALRAVTPGTGYQEPKPRPRSRASPPRLLAALHSGAQSVPGLERTTILLAHAIHPLEALSRPPEAHAFKDMPAFQVDSVTEAEHLPPAKAPPAQEEPQEAKVQAGEAESAGFRFAAQPFDWNARLPTPARHTLKALQKALPEASFGGLDWSLRRTSGVPLTNPMSRAKRPLRGVLDARLPKCSPEHNMFTVDSGPSFPPGRKRRSSLPSFPTSRHTP